MKLRPSKSHFYFVIFISINVNNAFAQRPDEDADHYILDTYDDFSSFNSNLWNDVPNNTWGLETYDASHVNVSNGELSLTCIKSGSVYISGGVETVGKKMFGYGYFEIESKWPASGHKGPWGGFWMHSSNWGWNEIDIMEPDGCDTQTGTSFHSATITPPGPSSNLHHVHNIGFSNLSVSYNKYALLWTPNHVQIFVNNNLIVDHKSTVNIPSNPMFLFLTFQIDPYGCQPSTFFPFGWTKTWKFKNFKYYTLKTDCNNGITQSNFDFINHDYKVQKFYNLSNSTVPTSSNIVLRATDYVELSGVFEVPQGSTLTIATHYDTCPN